MIRLSPAALWRWQVGARVLLAIFGGYALAALSSARIALLCARIMPPPDATLTGMLLSFILYAAIIIWTFSASTLRRACSVPLLLAGLLLLAH